MQHFHDRCYSTQCLLFFILILMRVGLISLMRQNPLRDHISEMELVIVTFLQNATIVYSSESVCIRVVFFLHNTSKSNRSRNMQFEYNVVPVYQNISGQV